MTHKDRAEFINRFVEDNCKRLMLSKGVEYARDDEDANANFKRLARQLNSRGIDKYDILFVYMTKHIDSLTHWFDTRKESSEPIEGRIADIINYLLILASMLEEDKLFVNRMREIDKGEE